MRVLVACECSGQVRDSFRAIGHDAWSNDLEGVEADGEWSNYHLYGDCRRFFDSAPGGQPWDLLIAHPPCTYLTNSAEWAYAPPNFVKYPGVGYHQKVKPEILTGAERRLARANATQLVRDIMAAPIARKCLENPIGVLSSVFRKPDQIVQPYQFGADASKATCLWLENLNPLVPTKQIAPRMVNGRPRWANQTDSGQNKLSPGSYRTAVRSMTYTGIAEAMAMQWGGGEYVKAASQ